MRRDKQQQEALELFHTLMPLMHRHLVERCAELDLTTLQAMALRELEEPQAMGALAGRLHCDASNLTGIADRLEERGLLERRPEPSDRRVKQLVRTDKGGKVYDALNRRLGDELPLLRGLTDEQADQLISLLRLVLAAAEEGRA